MEILTQDSHVGDLPVQLWQQKSAQGVGGSIFVPGRCSKKAECAAFIQNYAVNQI